MAPINVTASIENDTQLTERCLQGVGPAEKYGCQGSQAQENCSKAGVIILQQKLIM